MTTQILKNDRNGYAPMLVHACAPQAGFARYAGINDCGVLFWAGIIGIDIAYPFENTRGNIPWISS